MQIPFPIHSSEATPKAAFTPRFRDLSVENPDAHELRSPRPGDILFTGILRPFPGHEYSEVADRILERAKLVFPSAGLDPIVGADPENFWEDAARAEAAIDVAGDRLVVFRQPGQPAVRLSDGVLFDAQEMIDSGMLRLGPILNIEDDRHDWFIGDEVLARFSGRPTLIGGTDIDQGEVSLPEGAVNIIPFLTELHELGFTHAVLKRTRTKTGIHRIPLFPSDDLNRRSLSAVDGWEFYRLDGKPDAWQAQAWVPMFDEYRLFVVDGELVAGAGCVEEFTPLEHRGQQFDTRVRDRRGRLQPGSQSISADAASVEELVAFATPIARERGGTFVLDVAHGTDGPLVVEGNDISNAGVFAADPRAIYAALRDAHLRHGA